MAVLGLVVAVFHLLLHAEPCDALFGFGNSGSSEGSSSEGIPKSTASGCLGWRQTSQCRGHGERDPSGDMSCSQVVGSDKSGFCECVFGVVARTDCNHRRFSCDRVCHQGFDQIAVTTSESDLVGSVWLWNDWREVSFLEDGVFEAPTAECQRGHCEWRQSEAFVHIMWGQQGMHSVKVNADGDKMEGIKFDGQRLFASVVRRREKAEDLYETLGVSEDCDSGDIKKAYRALSKALHPDKVETERREEAERELLKVQRAYEVLKEEDLRMVFDTGGIEAVDRALDPNQQQHHRMDPLSMLFGNGNRNNNGNGNARDALLQMEVSLESLFNGAEMRHNFNRRVVCRRCRDITDANRERCKECRSRCPGEVKLVTKRMGNMMVQQQEEVPSKERCKNEDALLEVHVERGMRDGDEIRFARKNEQTPGMIPGDVVLRLKQKKHRVFTPENDHDLSMQLKVSLKEALVGVDTHITHLDGREVPIRTKQGRVSRPGMVIEVLDEGMPMRDVPSQRGKLMVHISVDFPKSLTAEQAEMISRLF